MRNGGDVFWLRSIAAGELVVVQNWKETGDKVSCVSRSWHGGAVLPVPAAIECGSVFHKWSLCVIQRLPFFPDKYTEKGCRLPRRQSQELLYHMLSSLWVHLNSLGEPI